MRCFIKDVKFYKREKWNKTLISPFGELFKELRGKESRVYNTTQAIATETKQRATNGVQSVNLYMIQSYHYGNIHGYYGDTVAMTTSLL